jgi:2'-5' RNA ligase
MALDPRQPASPGLRENAGGALRVFVAVPLPDAVRATVRALVDEVTSDPALAAAGRLRWVVGENLHLTLRFLGATAPERIAAVAAAAGRAAAAWEPFAVRLAGAGGFPSSARPRVVWLGIVAGAGDLEDLAAGLDAELAAAGWPPDSRPFRAHLTIARADGVSGAGRAVEALAAAARSLDAAWLVDRVVVYRSELGRGPARYTPLASAPLGAPRRRRELEP